MTHYRSEREDAYQWALQSYMDADCPHCAARLDRPETLRKMHVFGGADVRGRLDAITEMLAEMRCICGRDSETHQVAERYGDAVLLVEYGERWIGDRE